MNSLQTVQALSALAQETRLAVFRALVVAGEQGLRPAELMDRLAVTPSALSFHLKELLQAQLVWQEREGRHLIYRADLARMNGLLDYLSENCCQGQPCRDGDQGSFNRLRQGATMRQKIYQVLFLCSGNSARSIMAEACLNKLGGPRFRAYSAGSHPSGIVHPLTLELLEQQHFETRGLRSKSWDEFSGPHAPAMDFVFTVCDLAAAEPCPKWPGQPISAHWGIPDPVQSDRDSQQLRQAFLETFLALNRRISLLLALPVDKLDALSLQAEFQRIGSS